MKDAHRGNLCSKVPEPEGGVARGGDHHSVGGVARAVRQLVVMAAQSLHRGFGLNVPQYRSSVLKRESTLKLFALVKHLLLIITQEAVII